MFEEVKRWQGNEIYLQINTKISTNSLSLSLSLCTLLSFLSTRQREGGLPIEPSTTVLSTSTSVSLSTSKDEPGDSTVSNGGRRVLQQDGTEAPETMTSLDESLSTSNSEDEPGDDGTRRKRLLLVGSGDAENKTPGISTSKSAREDETEFNQEEGADADDGEGGENDGTRVLQTETITPGNNDQMSTSVDDTSTSSDEDSIDTTSSDEDSIDSTSSDELASSSGPTTITSKLEASSASKNTMRFWVSCCAFVALFVAMK